MYSISLVTPVGFMRMFYSEKLTDFIGGSSSLYCLSFGNEAYD